MCLQVVNRLGKDALVGHDGVRRKDWHDYEAIKRDASRSGGSKPPHEYYTAQSQQYTFIMHTLFVAVEKNAYTEERFLHLYAHIHSNPHIDTHSIVFPLWVLLLCSSGVNLCFKCSSAIINTVYICYSHHQLRFIFCSGKSA